MLMNGLIFTKFFMKFVPLEDKATA